ncbi:MAG: hypothetical protein WBY73_10330, partial [Candidatus Acidiferrales bacterium]
MNSRNTKSLVPFFALLLAAAVADEPLAAQATGSPAQQAPAQQASAPARFEFGGNAAQIPAYFVRNLIFVPVRVNGSKTFLFELDSSAATSSLDPERAAQLDVKLQQAGGADASAAAVRNVVLELPGLQIPVASLPEISRQNFAEQTGQPSFGVLGKDFFDRVVIEVD